MLLAKALVFALAARFCYSDDDEDVKYEGYDDDELPLYANCITEGQCGMGYRYK